MNKDGGCKRRHVFWPVFSLLKEQGDSGMEQKGEEKLVWQVWELAFRWAS